mmetsp:Transcript_27629/g.46338  ORF Transcript_27629/g.46338 Transcript_27629/m.46338 type:complete len:236 (-) Transcript_27629:247-954(-)
MAVTSSGDCSTGSCRWPRGDTAVCCSGTCIVSIIIDVTLDETSRSDPMPFTMPELGETELVLPPRSTAMDTSRVAAPFATTTPIATVLRPTSFHTSLVTMTSPDSQYLSTSAISCRGRPARKKNFRPGKEDPMCAFLSIPHTNATNSPAAMTILTLKLVVSVDPCTDSAPPDETDPYLPLRLLIDPANSNEHFAACAQAFKRGLWSLLFDPSPSFMRNRQKRASPITCITSPPKA